MTLQEAQRILKKPVFGDDKCLQAKKLLEEEEAAKALRKQLAKYTEARICRNCAAVQVGEKCLSCDATTLLVTSALLESWDYETLTGVLEELHQRGSQ